MKPEQIKQEIRGRNPDARFIAGMDLALVGKLMQMYGVCRAVYDADTIHAQTVLTQRATGIVIKDSKESAFDLIEEYQHLSDDNAPVIVWLNRFSPTSVGGALAAAAGRMGKVLGSDWFQHLPLSKRQQVVHAVEMLQEALQDF